MFFDRGSKYDLRGKELIEQDIDNDRFIEIGNIVFSQYSSKEGVDRKDYKELPSKYRYWLGLRAPMQCYAGSNYKL